MSAVDLEKTAVARGLEKKRTFRLPITRFIIAPNASAPPLWENKLKAWNVSWRPEELSSSAPRPKPSGSAMR